MLTFSSTRPTVWVLVALVAAAAGLAAYDAAVAADPVASQADAKNHHAGELKITPEKHDFGQAIEFAHSAPLTVTATNKSKSASIDFSSIVASPPFAIQSDGCSGAPLVAGKSCQVEVEFLPTATGKVKNKKALTFTDSAKKSPQHVELEGRGIVGPTPTITAMPPTPTITATAPTRTVTATCTPLPTPYVAGLVLIAGGQGSDGTPLNTAEVFNPKTNKFTLTTAPALGGSNMTDGRYSHAAAAVSTVTGSASSVVVTGGIDASGATNSIETFATNTNQFTASGAMSDSRVGHTETFLVMPIGEVLVTGGRDASGTVLKSAEVYNYVSFSPATSPMNTPRVNAAASAEQVYEHPACNPSAQALITGGSDGLNTLQTAEVFDSLSGTFTLTNDVSLGGSQMNAPRVFHTATLYDGEILIAGGQGAAGVAQSTAEVFNLATNIFTLTTGLGGTDMTVARAKHTATALGQVLIAGGIDSSGNALATAEVFDLSTNSFTAVGSMHSARFDHAAAILPNGKVLITGGEDGSGNTLNTAEIFDPVTNKFTLTTDASLGGNNMNVARKLHTATAY